jgi:hypothetical protein
MTSSYEINQIINEIIESIKETNEINNAWDRLNHQEKKEFSDEINDILLYYL